MDRQHHRAGAELSLRAILGPSRVPGRISGLEQMTPTERERYYCELRLTHPKPVVPVCPYYYGP